MLLAGLVLGVLAMIAPGCSALGSAKDLFVKRTPTVVREAQTNYVQVLRTNYVGVTAYITNYVTLQAAATNAATGAITPAIVQPQLIPQDTVVPITVTNLQMQILPAIIVTNLSVSPALSGAVQVAGDLAPVPWGGAVGSLLLGVVGSVFGFINHRRANAALGEKDTWQDATRTLVGNFETYRSSMLKLPGYTPALDAQIMRIVEAAQYAAGVKDTVAAVVNEHKTQTLPDGFFGPVPGAAKPV